MANPDGTVRRFCVFAHYDQDHIVDDYVIYYLRALRPAVQRLVFVTVCELSDQARGQLESLDVEVIQRKNEGYDFYSYKVGLRALSLEEGDELVLCNDSCYGPLRDIPELFTAMDAQRCDAWSITASDEIAFHMQSYFMVFRAGIVQSQWFRDFWQNLEMLDSKEEIVRRYEVGLSRELLEHGQEISSWRALSAPQDKLAHRAANVFRRAVRKLREPGFVAFLCKRLRQGGGFKLNPTQYNYLSDIRSGNACFLKIEILRDNPLGIVDREAVLALLGKHTQYPVALIRAHLERVTSGR